MNRSDILRAVAPLRLIFWGGLLTLFDLNFSQTTNGTGWTFDLLNDAVGAAMIAWAVFRLSEIHVHDRYARAMRFVKVVAALSVLDSIHGHFVYEEPGLFVFAGLLLGIASLAAIISFCFAMRWFCAEAALDEPARSWRVTTMLFASIYGLPLGLSYFAAIIATITGGDFNVSLGPAGLLLVFAFAIPLVHLFVSTSRMRKAAGG